MAHVHPPLMMFRLTIVWLVLGSLLGPAPQVLATPTVPNAPLPRVALARATPQPSQTLAPTAPLTTVLPAVCRSNINLAINDNSSITDSINITTPGVLVDLNVTLSGTHSAVGDMQFFLTHQSTGIRARVVDSTCSNDNFLVELDDEGVDGRVETQCNPNPALFGRPRPDAPLTLFDGQDLNTTWSLNVQDLVANDTGVLQTWCLVPTVISAPVYYAPILSVLPTSVAQNQPISTVQTQTLTLANDGNAPLLAQISEGRATSPMSLLLYDNGPIVNSLGTGVGGADESLVQTGFGMGSNGFDQEQSSNERVADDFPMPALHHWRVTNAVFWGYDLDGSSTSMNETYYRILNGPPNAGGSGVFGDLTTNRFVAGVYANILRAYDFDSSNSTRRYIQRLLASGGVTLTAGNSYWVEWSTDGPSVDAFAAPITINGLTSTGNGLRYIGGNWSPALDFGTNTQQGFPFQLYGYPLSPRCTNPADAPWLTLAGQLSGTINSGLDNVINVGFNTNGLTSGNTYTATLCILSSDPDQQLMEVPVTLTVGSVGIPALGLSQATFYASQQVNTTTTQNFQILNSGAATLTWSLGEAYGTNLDPARLTEEVTTIPSPYGTDRAHAPVRPAPLAVEPAAPQVQAPAAVPLVSLSENFTSVASLTALGWAMTNTSQPLGITNWAQGNTAIFPAHQGAANAYIYANYNNTAGAGTISNWLLTPELVLRPGATLVFYTRVPTTTNYADRLQVRLSTNGASTNVGNSATSVGDFTSVLLDINPTYVITGGYPNQWAAYTLPITTVAAPVSGRIAFRYFVENGGPNGTRSNYIGIDSVSYSAPSDCSTLSDMPWLTASQTSGNTVNGTPASIALTFNATGLFWGQQYTGKLCLTSNDPNNSLRELPVVLNVLPYLTYGPFIKK